MDIPWEYLLGAIIIVTAGAGLIVGKVTEQGFIALVGIVIAFVTGRIAINVLSMLLKTNK